MGKLYTLLNHLEKAGLDTKLIEAPPNREVDVVYIDQAHIEYCFDDDNRQVAPISLFIRTHKLDKFTTCLAEQLYFRFEQYQVSKYLSNYHYRLHPMTEKNHLQGT
ncbi:hypothetical protein VCRA2119O149_20053 [Vibrio crassostreae]|nr:DUF2913 family protein [Vibrio kanaloae]CAK2815154.1 hypothetical protein VCRA2119O149_20053 [Vibrio crassostreae]